MEEAERAAERNLLYPEEFRIAEETNRARDHFVHFEVGRFELPHYFGEDVTSEAGYRRFPPRRHDVRRERPVPVFLTKTNPNPKIGRESNRG
jgi:hypothetical protein